MESGQKRRANNGYSVVWFMVVFFPLCWTMVIGDQAGWGLLNPPRHMLLESALIIGYTGTIMSAGVIAVAIAAAVRTRKRTQ